MNNWRSLVLTAQRAGVRRTLTRLRRIFILRLLYPRFAERLYPLRAVTLKRTLADDVLASRYTPSEIWNGQVRLLNTPAFEMRLPVDWNANPIQHTLWQFRLHEWEWAFPLIHHAGQDAGAAVELVALLKDYLQNVPLGHPTAYEPYPLSRRLVVWCEALRVLDASHTDNAFVQTLASELDRGARMLANNLEFDLTNNHLIANAKALAFVGTLLEQTYGVSGLNLLWDQLASQVRADGGHVENSTTYHFLVRRDAAETCALAREFGIEVPNDVATRVALMGEFLDTLQYPDGTFPLLNDSVQDELPTARPSRSPKTSKVFRESGYARLSNANTHLIFDAGALGPTYCPGHGHADTLSFELFAFGHSRILDPGTYQYQAGAWRDYFRGTAAHNTLQVDGLDSSEVSGSFRVGRMANARVWQEDEWLCGEHDGYTRLNEPITHTRKIRLQDENVILIQDEIRGRGTHDYALRFHLAPDAIATTDHRRRASDSGSSATIQFGDGVKMIIEMSGAAGTIEIVDGWTSPTWYTKIAAPVVEWKWRGDAPFRVETRIRFEDNGMAR